MESVDAVWGGGVKGVDQACHLLLRGQGVKKICCDVGKLHEIQTSVSISQVLLEHSQTHPFAYSLWRFHTSCQPRAVVTEITWPMMARLCTIPPMTG